MFKDKRMRQALYLAMDKKPIVEKIWLDLVPEAESYVPPQSWAYNPKIKGKHRYDPERAKKLLDEMGWKVGGDGIRVKDGQRLSFENACTAGNKQREQVQQVLQQQWRQVGVEMKINNKPAAVLFGDFYRMSKFETILIGMAMGSDPEHSFRLHSRYIPVKGGMGRNSVAYESAKMDRALDTGVRDIDREKRKKAYFRAQEIFADELPYLPIFHYVNIRGARKGIEGFQPNSNMQEFSWNTNEWWIKKT
jgi:peptide/nickel transport system substrate-binding protein